MCEKKIRKITKGSQLARLREARRLQRMQRMTPSPPPVADTNPPPRLPQMLPIDKTIQNKVILELAWKTVILMHKNKLIQQKIRALQKETSDFVAAFMNPSQNRFIYMEQLRTQEHTAQDITMENKENNTFIFKTEPKDA